ncbi:protein-disulfide reductase DsbD [Actinobacillus succinogenes]|uniref:Thiol:disulfide interchange protein DsbD n=1 Tax=Actinobacillus succinogenes (strain ATCC 55618 / DSM 22257 / CCUG 43843 / 130Z) TaxID=339671 RepID=A6VNG3_ACTSZ|nr:protein-disulfide reductase DsbD [Actinobacillus succinogenes]ABR74510.1 Protein-disulfide reductase [Actinobacillus succinogenes 130Z]PHI41072.1 protein-disulfide reductase DsbD [Actinobacillus succinogenes]
MKRLFLFLTLILIALSAQAGLFGSAESRFLRADDAFRFSTQQQGDELTLNWRIADDYYLYRKEIRLQGKHVDVGAADFPQGEMHQDEFFGETEIYLNRLTLTVPLRNMADDAEIEVTYQGCTKGFCYPPETRTVALMAPTGKRSADAQSAVKKTDENPTALSNAASEQDRLAARLFRSKYAVFWFFLLGLGLAFTPCVLPMLPLLSAVVIGQGARPNTWRAFTLSVVYVQGMALTYTLLGLLVAAIGLPFQVALQSPPVLITLSVLFVLLAASMFGAFNLQLPASWQTKLTQISQNQQSGAFGGVFVMGMLAGLVASPCTTAPLSGALLYVAQSGDLLTGAVTLYLLALGMGVPLILITLFGNKILPKSGAWMNRVKELFGFVLLLLPVILLERVFPAWSASLWAVWAIAFCCWLASKYYWLGLLVSLAAFFAVHGIHHTDSAESAVEKSAVFQPHFSRIHSYNELQRALTANPKAVAMLDLYADWCVACKEFEKYTFPAPAVRQAFEHVLLLRADMTKNSAENMELMKRLNVMGLPTIIFFDQKGKEIQSARVTGFMQAQPFADWVNGLTK